MHKSADRVLSCAVAMQAGTGGRLSNTLRRASMMLPGAAQHERHVAFASGQAASEPPPKEELLGGELVVKIEDATVRSMPLKVILSLPHCHLIALVRIAPPCG